MIGGGIPLEAIEVELKHAETKYPDWPDNRAEQVIIVEAQVGKMSRSTEHLRRARLAGDVDAVKALDTAIRNHALETIATCIRVLKY